MKQIVKPQYSSNEFFVLENKAIYFAKENEVLDCIKIIKYSNAREIYISWFGILLTGGSESTKPYNECFFGILDSKDSNLGLDESKPIYHLIGEIDSNSIESTSNNRDSNNSLSTLQVFLGSNTLTLLNYSLLDSSLNTKLECNSKESKEIVEKEQTQREQKEQDLETQDSLSTAMLHPVLEDNEIKCPHGGVVKLKSNKGKPFKSKDVPMILESDLLNSQIIGCTNNILGVPTPCTQVSVILPTARALKKYNDDYPIMQDLVNGNIFTDKGFPLIATPKPNTFKINSPKPSSAKEANKESKETNIDTSIPLCKIITSFKDLDKFYLTPTYYENRDSKDRLISSQSKFYNTYKQIDIELDSIIKDTNTLDSSKIESNQCLKDVDL